MPDTMNTVRSGRRAPFLLVAEIAAELRCSENEVRRLIHTGAWTAVRGARGAWLTAPAELDRYVASLPTNR